MDVVLDCTSGAGTAPVLLGIDALKRREGIMVTQGEEAAFPDFPLKKMTEKCITLASARGHSYRSVELALEQLASDRFPLERLATTASGSPTSTTRSARWPARPARTPSTSR